MTCLALHFGLLQSKDGIFWMSWQDFQIHFRSIYVCRVYPPEMRYSIHGQWRGYSAGGCQDFDTWHQNPQFRLRVTGPEASSPIHVFITLTQVRTKYTSRGAKTANLAKLGRFGLGQLKWVGITVGNADFGSPITWLKTKSI